MRNFALITAAALMAGLAAAPAVQAQTYVDEVIVEGPYGREGPRSLSRVVSFADLDLTTPEGREVLRLRVHETAGDLCRTLQEEPDAPSALVPSCRRQAIRDARHQVKRAIDRAYQAATYAYLDPRFVP